MKKALLLYSSIDGHTETICKKMAEELGKDTHISSISDAPENIDTFETIVIGASIRYGKYREEVFKFIEKKTCNLVATMVNCKRFAFKADS